jgi:aminomethyltransferase
MGEIFVRGPRALEFVQMVSCNDHSKMAVGRAQYTGLMYPEGTFVDDLLVHRTDENEYLLVVNAANVDKDFAYLADLADLAADVEVSNRSDDWAQIAIQGPLAADILQPLTAVDLGQLKYYRFTWGEVSGIHALIARTGYTGEDGFEIYTDPAASSGIWRMLLEAGGPKGLLPAGLGARDTLRLEAGMALYGNDIDETTTPLEAGLGWIVKLGKGDFIGRDVLERQKEQGVERKLVGFEVLERGIARHGYPIYLQQGGEPVGQVTSGTQLPTFGKSMGMAYVPSSAADDGQEFLIGIRQKYVPARVVALPFYSRKKAT